MAMQRKKVTLETNGELIAIAQQMGETMGISTAGIVDRLLLEGLQRFADGQIDFDGYLVPTDRGRYRWSVEVKPNGLGQAVAERLEVA
jgi:hypothetical protein